MRDARRPVDFLRRGRQVRAIPAARLVAGRDGRPDARVRLDPRRDDGGRRCLHALPHVVFVQRRRAARHRLHRRIHRAARRAHRRPAKRHQTHHRLLDAVATRLHGHGRRLERPDAGDVSSDHARVFQSAAVLERRLGHPRDAPRAGHLANGQSAQENARSPSGHFSSARWP